MKNTTKRLARFSVGMAILLVVSMALQQTAVTNAQVTEAQELDVPVLEDVIIPDFSSCVDLLDEPGDMASYPVGLHEILGLGLMSGADDVYSMGQGNAVQCYCPPTGNEGIQTNWWKTDQTLEGWTQIPDGAVWGLDDGPYLAKNIDFECEENPDGGGGDGEGDDVTIRAVKVIDADGDLETTDDQAAGSDWEFNVAGTTESTDSEGETNSVSINAGTYSVSEVLQEGYEVVDATCTGAGNNGSFDNDNSVTGIEVLDEQDVVCTFYNTFRDQGGGDDNPTTLTSSGSRSNGGGGGDDDDGGGDDGSVSDNDNPVTESETTPDDGLVLGKSIDSGDVGGSGGNVNPGAILPRTGLPNAMLVLMGLVAIGLVFFSERKAKRA